MVVISYSNQCSFCQFLNTSHMGPKTLLPLVVGPLHPSSFLPYHLQQPVKHFCYNLIYCGLADAPPFLPDDLQVSLSAPRPPDIDLCLEVGPNILNDVKVPTLCWEVLHEGQIEGGEGSNGRP